MKDNFGGYFYPSRMSVLFCFVFPFFFPQNKLSEEYYANLSM